jgi:hypothetical protein
MDHCEIASGDYDYGKVDKMKRFDQYQSVEFSVDGVHVPNHRSRIWHIPPHSNIILIRKDSNIAPHLRVGGRLKTKYYPPGRAYPDGARETTIKEISAEEQGRFKGHSLVDLEPSQEL